MVKKVNFGAKRPTDQPPPTAVDNWVENREPGASEPTKRLTIDVSRSLHRRIKSQCALQNLVMADEIRDVRREYRKAGFCAQVKACRLILPRTRHC
jgi:hypothetical protein